MRSQRMTATFTDGQRVHHDRWNCDGTVRHVPYEEEERREDPSLPEYIAEVQWDRSMVADELELVQDHLSPVREDDDEQEASR
jgi:hypothetical protein